MQNPVLKLFSHVSSEGWPKRENAQHDRFSILVRDSGQKVELGSMSGEPGFAESGLNAARRSEERLV